MKTLIWFSIFASIWFTPKCFSQKKIALVVGAKNYAIAPLTNTVNDAEDMATSLQKKGFEIIKLIDPDKLSLKNALVQMEKKLFGQKDAVALFYYSGHGIQFQGENYLVPVTAKMESAAFVDEECLRLSTVFKIMENANQNLNIIILDACRNNPFPSFTRSTDQGLRRVDAPQGSIVNFSTSPGNVAQDGNGRNGTYTSVLLKYLDSPGLDLLEVFNATAREVAQLTQKKQIPWSNFSYVDPFYFTPGQEKSPVETTPITSYTTSSNDFAGISRSGLTDGPQAKESSKNFDLPWLEMVYVEGGKFRMGNLDGEESEKPIHEVTVSSFFIGKFEITYQQWRIVMGENHPKTPKNCPDCPVVEVSWEDTQKFINRLNQQTGQKFRLPTEAEWEYAARGGQLGRAYDYAGHFMVDSVAWYEENSKKKPQPIGFKLPNELGIHDMSGNVAEWCNDWYGKDYYNNSPEVNPKGPSSGQYKISRGGSWFDLSAGVLVGRRNYHHPYSKFDFLGFRLVREL